MSLLYEILDAETIATIDYRVDNMEPMLHITSSFENLSRSEKAILVDYVKQRRNPPPPLAQGHKTEPYYKDEDEIGVIPTYSWDELSDVEKDFYNKQNEN
jgi:hypothetical protein